MGYRELDAHLVAPKRFVTLAHLHQVEQADYAALQEATGLTTSDLSRIVGDLEDRGLVMVSKERKNRYVNTVVRLSVDGHTQFKQLLRTLNRVAGQ